METRYDGLIDALRRASCWSPPLPPAFDAYLEKVRDGAFRVTDEDVRELVDAGFSEDEIFEHTVATAVAAGLDRLDAGLRTLG